MTRFPHRFFGRGIIKTLIPSLVLSVSACGGSDSGPISFCVSDGPTISNLSLLPDSAVLGEGGGNIDVAVSFDYRTRDGAQLSIIEFRLVDTSGSRVVDEVMVVYDQNLQGQGIYTFSLNAPTQTAQSYTLRVRLFDECSENSRWAEVNFSVIEPAGLGSKTDFGVARLNNGLYVIGGRDASGFASKALLHCEPRTGAMTFRAPMPEGRFSAAVATYGDLIFVFGGIAFGYTQDSTFAYDSRTDSWSVRSPVPRDVSGADVSVFDGVIYIAKDGYVHRYDPVTDIWSPSAPR